MIHSGRVIHTAAIFPAAGKNERQVFAMRGWLQKQSPSKLKGLQRRFFVL